MLFQIRSHHPHLWDWEIVYLLKDHNYNVANVVKELQERCLCKQPAIVSNNNMILKKEVLND